MLSNSVHRSRSFIELLRVSSQKVSFSSAIAAGSTCVHFHSTEIPTSTHHDYQYDQRMNHNKESQTIRTMSTLLTSDNDHQLQIFSCKELTSTTSSESIFSISSRKFSSETKKNQDDENEDQDMKINAIGDGIDSFTRKEMQKRNEGIVMNANGLSSQVLPGDFIVKTNPRTGDKKMVQIERSMGYFWDLKDLRDTGEKPVISNTELIPIEKAQVFPLLDGDLKTLTDEEVVLPNFFTQNNRSKDPSAECTLVVISFNEYGNKMLSSWTDPFEQAFAQDWNRVKVVCLSINEGRVLSMLRYFIANASKRHVPEYKHKNYIVQFGDCAEFRDIIRMHNKKTGYAFLLDGIGRVRFAGSGRASEDELKLLIDFVNELTPGLKASKLTKGKKNDDTSKRNSNTRQ